MEHPCYRCGTIVEEGTAFCPQCQAPQIRVAAAQPEQANTIEGTPLSAAVAGHPIGFQWSQALPPAAWAGMVSAGLMVLPLGGFGLGMLAAGFLCVILYRRRNPYVNLTAGLGARLGAVSGIFGFGIFVVFTGIATTLFHSGGELRSALTEAIRQAAARNPDPQAQHVLEFFKTPEGMAVVVAFGLAFMFLIFLVLSSLGGALSAALLRSKHRPG
jgi:hypothetical protein